MSAEAVPQSKPTRVLAPATLSFWGYLKSRRVTEAILTLNRGGRLPRFIILRGHHFNSLTPEAAARELPPGEWCREATPADTALWVEMHRPAEVFEEWIARGERAFLGGFDDELATVFWIHNDVFEIWDQRCWVVCGGGTWYIRDGYTRPKFRARGFRSRLQSEFVRQLGVTRVVNTCDFLNERAKTAWKRSGWFRYGSLITLGLFGFKLFRWTSYTGDRPQSRWFACRPGRYLEIDAETRSARGVRSSRDR